MTAWVRPLLANESFVPTYEASGWLALDEPWKVGLFAAVAIVATALLWRLYWRDGVDLKPGWGWLLMGLRLGALVALFCFFLQYQKRVDRLETLDSRVLVLVDTSASMGRGDPDLASRGVVGSRIEQTVSQLTDGAMIEQLRERHDVEVLRFDAQPHAEPIVRLAKRRSPNAAGDLAATTLDESTDQPTTVGERLRSIAAATPEELWKILAAVAAITVALAAHWFARERSRRRMSVAQGIPALLGVIAPLIPVIALISLAYLQRGRIEQSHAPITTASFQPPSNDASDAEPKGGESKGAGPVDAGDWQTTLVEKLQADGVETRLGDALKQLIHDQRVHPISAVVVFTDGAQNAGSDATEAIELAKSANIPLYIVGVGSDRLAPSVRIGDFDAPARVFPDDEFVATAFLQSSGYSGQTINVELLSIDGEPKAGAIERHEQSQAVRLGEDGQSIPVKFSVRPSGASRRTYVARIDAPRDDRDLQDNEAFASVEVVDRKLRALVMASGPNREYRYLRNQLFRDKDVELHVLLQIAPPGPGISQDADEILAEFPDTPEKFDQYDVVVAFDPDWRLLSAAQVETLEDWVGRNAGGLVVVAGPVYTSAWASDPKAASHLNRIRALYPVLLPRRGLALASDAEKFRSTTPWQIELTRAGLDAPFLRLAESAAASESIWSEFEGVYGYYPASGVKPGATVYGRYATPDEGEALPIYFAGQFYGAGRVFYMGSGEIWRIRALDAKYFETFYVKLLRFVSEGRLLRGRKRGSILLESRKFVRGQSIVVQAILRDVDGKPLEAKEMPLAASLPNGQTTTIQMTANPVRPGMYRADFPARIAGNYQLEIKLPGSQEETIADSVRVVEPDLENDYSRRDDALLGALAAGTGGKYFVGADAIESSGVSLASQLRDATRQLRIRGTTSAEWDRLWSACLLGLIVGLLFTEWTLRRLLKLA